MSRTCYIKMCYIMFKYILHSEVKYYFFPPKNKKTVNTGLLKVINLRCERHGKTCPALRVIILNLCSPP